MLEKNRLFDVNVTYCQIFRHQTTREQQSGTKNLLKSFIQLQSFIAVKGNKHNLPAKDVSWAYDEFLGLTISAIDCYISSIARTDGPRTDYMHNEFRPQGLGTRTTVFLESFPKAHRTRKNSVVL